MTARRGNRRIAHRMEFSYRWNFNFNHQEFSLTAEKMVEQVIFNMSHLQIAQAAADLEEPTPTLTRLETTSGINDLPTELLDAILRELHSSNSASLAACVLVSRAWSQSGYPYRFSKIACTLLPGTSDESSQEDKFRPPNVKPEEIVSFLKATPRVAMHVKQISLCTDCTALLLPGLVVEIVALLPSLSSLEISGFYLHFQLPNRIAESSIPKPMLQHLSLRGVVCHSAGLGCLLSIFGSVECLETTRFTCHATPPQIETHMIPSTPVKSLLIIPSIIEASNPMGMLPGALAQFLQGDALQFIEIIPKAKIYFPDMLNDFIHLSGLRGLRSMKLGALSLEIDDEGYIDLSSCCDLVNLDLVIVMPYACCQAERNEQSRRLFLECTWPSVLKTVLGTSATLRTLSLCLRIENRVNLSRVETSPSNIAGHLQRLDWELLEQAIEEHPNLQEVHVQINAEDITSFPAHADLTRDAQEVIRYSCFKSQQTRQILRVSVFSS